LALALMFVATLPLAGQATLDAAKSALPRTPDGHPDLQGTYDLSMMTPLERLPGDPPFLTKEQAETLQKAEVQRRAKNNQPSSADRPAPPVGGDTSTPKSFFEVLERAGGGAVGGYNNFCLHQGSAYTVVDGQIRTSIVVDPPDGHVPPYNAAARQRQDAARATPTSDTRESRDSNAEPPGSFDNPEQRPLGERCLLGFGSTSGPPALPDYFYNDLHQIVQTPDSIMILTEMVHDARIVRINAQHLPKNIRRWMGDSVGHWEGDTLVVDVISFNDRTWIGATGTFHSEAMHVTERYTRVDYNRINYDVTVEDPKVLTKPWIMHSSIMLRNGTRLREYECAENNTDIQHYEQMLKDESLFRRK